MGYSGEINTKLPELPIEVFNKVMLYNIHPVAELFQTFLRKTETAEYDFKLKAYKSYLNDSYSTKAMIYHNLSDDEDETRTESTTSLKELYRKKINKKIAYYERKINHINRKNMFYPINYF